MASNVTPRPQEKSLRQSPQGNGDSCEGCDQSSCESAPQSCRRNSQASPCKSSLGSLAQRTGLASLHPDAHDPRPRSSHTNTHHLGKCHPQLRGCPSFTSSPSRNAELCARPNLNRSQGQHSAAHPASHPRTHLPTHTVSDLPTQPGTEPPIDLPIQPSVHVETDSLNHQPIQLPVQPSSHSPIDPWTHSPSRSAAQPPSHLPAHLGSDPGSDSPSGLLTEPRSDNLSGVSYIMYPALPRIPPKNKMLDD
jgi:hypothetical protein